MGDPVKLVCSCCGDEYWLHPRDERPFDCADMCNQCTDAFEKWMQGWGEASPIVVEPKPRVTLGVLICGLSAFCVGLVILWLMFGR